MADCVVCIASRRSVVDAFMAGFRTGFKQSVIATAEGAGEVHDIKHPSYCLAHERMMTQAYADEIREAMKLDMATGDGCLGSRGDGEPKR